MSTASSYAYAVGNIRAKESAYLKKLDIEQLLSYDKVTECASFLKDKGYGFAETPTDVFSLLKDEEQKLWEYIISISPDVSVFDSFIIQNDYHNIKAIFKGTVVKADYEKLLLKPTIIDVKAIEKAAREQDFSGLPQYMVSAAKKAWAALVQTGDSQVCDAILDASCLEYKMACADSIKIPMLADMIKARVFFDNIKASIRCARAQKSPDFCDVCLTDTDIFTKKTLKEAALKGVDEVIALLETAAKYKGDEAAEAFKISPSQFEKFADNFITASLRKAKYIAVGAEPIIAYFGAKLAEIQAVRIVVNGIASGEPQDKTREMLRELYG